MGQLTTETVRKAEPLPDQDRHYELRDGDGLALRVYRGGTKAWYVWVHDPKKRPVRLGYWPDTKLAEARKLAAQERAAAAGRNSITVRDFILHQYLPDYARPRKASADEDERVARLDIIPAIGDTPVVAVTREQCHQVYQRGVDRGAASSAEKAHRVLSAVLSYAVDLGYRDWSPAQRMGIAKTPSRDRWLARGDLGRLAVAFQAEPHAYKRLALELILATAQRPGEVTELTWNEIDPLDRMWRMPAEKAKNRRAHDLPLSPWAWALVQEAATEAGHPSVDAAVRANSRPGASPARVVPVTDDQARRALRRAIERAEIGHYWRHDLRRTVASWLGRIGYSRTIQNIALNHVDQSIGGIYDQHSYLEEVRQALDEWAGVYLDTRAMAEKAEGEAP